DLRGAILKGLDFTDAMLTWSDFTGADLSNSTLHKALLGKCDFSNANLSGAYLGAVKFCGARLVQANLSESQVHSTLFINCDLSDAIGLKTCRHTGPSYLDHDTAQMSGPLPLVFLQGCGLSDQQIDYLNALHTQAIQYYSCFISYSTKDDDFANRLYADLQREGVRCWFAKKDIQGGQKIIEQIDRAIRYHEKLLLVLSNESMNSEWVKTEIAKARKREVHEGCRVLFPISIVDFETIKQWECFDGDTGKDSAREIREYYIPDFSKWINHSDYQREFDRLLRDLKQEHELKG
ncbi:MAG: toll/interleukin-1 receptor domain-containing protein, partial [Candidatus Thiodiazotropha sp. 4PDIV1]